MSMISIREGVPETIARVPGRRAARAARSERICRWILRLVLPVLVYLSGQVLYWIWFDNVYGPPDLGGFLAGAPLLVVAIAAGIWAIGVWSSADLH
jgi:hypothetical protein